MLIVGTCNDNNEDVKRTSFVASMLMSPSDDRFKDVVPTIPVTNEVIANELRTLIDAFDEAVTSRSRALINDKSSVVLSSCKLLLLTFMFEEVNCIPVIDSMFMLFDEEITRLLL